MTGLADVDGLLNTLTEDQIMEFQINMYEYRLTQLESYSRRTGKLGHCTNVQDLTCPSGLMSKALANYSRLGVLRRLQKRAEANYPGFIGRVVLVNAPLGIQAVLSLVRPFLSARLADMLEPVSESCTADRMRELIDPANLPQFLGGFAPDEEMAPGRASLLVKAGGQPLSGCQVSVGAGSSEMVSIVVEAGGTVAYSFSVADALDIVFSCRFVAGGCDNTTDIDASVVVHEPDRVKEVSGGCFVAPIQGCFLIEFDNSFSWINSKTVRYECVQVQTTGASRVSVDAPPKAGAFF